MKAEQLPRNWRQAQVEERWGMPFFDILFNLEQQGLNLRDAGRAIGYETKNQYIALRQVLDRNPEMNPWKHKHSIPAQYAIDTGEPFKDAIMRMSKTHTVSQAALEVGYTSQKNLRYAMAARGIEATFRKSGDKMHAA